MKNNLKQFVIKPASDKQLSSLDKAMVFNLLEEHGFLIFRGFEISVESYSDFVQSMSSKVTLDPAREFYAKNAQKVDAGKEAIGLHIENGNGPVVPDLCWFYCSVSPEEGSQTTVCDGSDVYQNLPDDLKAVFEDQKITYSRNVKEEIWRKYISHELKNSVAPEDVNESHLRIIEDNLPNLQTSINEDGSLHYQFETNAILKSGSLKSFANSILGPSFNYEKPKITLQNGQELHSGILEELEGLTERFTQEINWKDNDMVLIDNKRVMHGRREIISSKREIFNALSFK